MYGDAHEAVGMLPAQFVEEEASERTPPAPGAGTLFVDDGAGIVCGGAVRLLGMQGLTEENCKEQGD